MKIKTLALCALLAYSPLSAEDDLTGNLKHISYSACTSFLANSSIDLIFNNISNTQRNIISTCIGTIPGIVKELYDKRRGNKVNH